MKNKKMLCRLAVYIGGLLTLALGLVLNTKSDLGVSPIISTAFAGSTITGARFGDATFVVYSLFVIVEMMIHIKIVPKDRLKTGLIKDLLQIPLSFVFTRFVNLFSDHIPTAAEMFHGSMVMRFVMLLLAIICTGCGAAMSLDVRLIPNPGDGIVQALADLLKKKVGFMKNCFDVSCVCITLIICGIFLGKIVGVGIGTLMAVIGVGRIVALFNYFFLERIKGLM